MSSSSGRRRGCPVDRPCWRPRPARRCCRSACGTRPTAGASTSAHPSSFRSSGGCASGSRSALRRWLTPSPRISPPIRATGICCKDSGSRTWRSPGRGATRRRRPWSLVRHRCARRVAELRIGIVCPYSWNIPGGVQAHVRDLAETLIGLGHQVSVLAPGDEDTPDLPNHVVLAGKTVPVPYNGSVARVQFGLVSAARVRHWLRDGKFDVVHVHEPAAASLSLLTCMIHDGPLVATFHMATTRSRMLGMFDTMLQPFLEKLSGRIAVSTAARKVIVEHLGADAVVIPNGISIDRFRGAEPLAQFAGSGEAVGFIGR